ncbi:MAG: XdhC family protein, partial [Candidatus Obscuribacterales bacterium]|nr:XdhC family protein [Candidatus Obscuribacterales bacterium]
MAELESILAAYKAAESEKKQACLATVLSVSGSAYRRPGARMLIIEDGRSTGTVSAGCLEREVIETGLR